MVIPMADLIRWLAAALLIFLPAIGVARLSEDELNIRLQADGAREVVMSPVSVEPASAQPAPAEAESPARPRRHAWHAYRRQTAFAGYDRPPRAKKGRQKKTASEVIADAFQQAEERDRAAEVEREALVDKARATLKQANVAFNAPERGEIGKTFLVEAKISEVLTRPELSRKIEGPGKIESAPLQVSKRVIATLSGGEAFDVSPSGPQSKFVSESDITAWTWQVTPKSAGDDKLLILTFDAVIKVGDQIDNWTINTFRRSLHVEVDWPENASQWLDWAKKNGENIHWIWVTIILPTGVAFLAWLTGRRSGAASGDDKPDGRPGE
ncbi:MAG: hypothetical protein CTY15_01175 [Methylocystis sp.]|nr:MAG: hypothetical protein CTY15_01175 [Methylocystis sp.]